MDRNIHNLVADALARHPEIQLAIVFGSAAKGNMRKDSDVDVVDLYSAYCLILRQVLIKGKVVLKRSNTCLAMLIKRMLLDQADMEPLRKRIVEKSLQRGF